MLYEVITGFRELIDAVLAETRPIPEEWFKHSYNFV